jgi:hypothetical protein
MAVTETLLQKRRRIVKRAGRRFIKRIADLMARQSPVADRPVHDTANQQTADRWTRRRRIEGAAAPRGGARGT